MASYWENLILDVISRLGGEADMTEIYKWIETNVDLTERQLEDSGYQGRPRYQHALRSYASNMVCDGKLVRVSRGRFRMP